jgi:hypothetical protein
MGSERIPLLAHEAPLAPSAAPLALPNGHTASGRARMQTAIWWLERHALFVTALAVIAAVTLSKVPAHLNRDSWLALVDGRYVAQHGIPSHDSLAILTHGARWVDQQWLAQLTIYGLHQLGGLALYGILYVCLTVGGLGIAIAAARRLGGIDAHVMWVLPLGAFLYFAGSFQVRTQGFAYPLFAATLWLLAAEVRGASTRRVFLVFPLLILWANLHGSAILGAGLVTVCGVSLLITSCRSADRWRLRRRAMTLIVGAPLCLFITPYGASGISYYRETVANPVFKSLVTEWQPITSVTILAVPFFIGAFATAWVLGRAQGRVRLFDGLALILLTAAAISAVRNITWFALAVIILLPSALSSVVTRRSHAPRRRRLNLALLSISAVYLVVSLAVVAGRQSSWFQRDYEARALSAVATVVKHRPAVRIFADGHFADWLLWRDPALAGRIAYDSRLELLTSNQLRGLAQLGTIRPPGARSILTGYGLLVLDTTNEASSRLLTQPGVHTIIRGNGIAVATRSGA